MATSKKVKGKVKSAETGRYISDEAAVTADPSTVYAETNQPSAREARYLAAIREAVIALQLPVKRDVLLARLREIAPEAFED